MTLHANLPAAEADPDQGSCVARAPEGRTSGEQALWLAPKYADGARDVRDDSISVGGRKAPEALEPGRQILAVEELHRDEGRALPLAVLEHVHDVGAAELRRRRKRGLAPELPRRVFIHPEVCEGCGDCSEQSNCVAIEPLDTEFGRKRAIHQSSCNGDEACLAGLCPALITVRGARLILTSSDFAFAGRPPLEVDLTATINGVALDFTLIVLHAKALADTDSYTRRLDASKALKTYLDSQHASDRVLVAGDVNDDLVTSITSGKGTFTMDFDHYDEAPAPAREKIIAAAKSPEAEAP